jgi:hypothetical protein
MALGGGQMLFAWLALGTAAARWLVAVAFVGGIAGVLTLAVYQTPVLAMAQLLSFAVCAFAAGIALLRARLAPQ